MREQYLTADDLRESVWNTVILRSPVGELGSVPRGLLPFPMDPLDPLEYSGRLTFMRRHGT